eukprot:gene12009-331_t
MCGLCWLYLAPVSPGPGLGAVARLSGLVALVTAETPGVSGMGSSRAKQSVQLALGAQTTLFSGHKSYVLVPGANSNYCAAAGFTTISNAADCQAAAEAAHHGYTWDIATSIVDIAGDHADCYLHKTDCAPCDYQVKFNINNGPAGTPPDATNRLSLCIQDDPIYSVSWSPDGTELVSTGADSEARIWAQNGGAERLVFRAHVNAQSPCSSDACSPRDLWAVMWSPSPGTEIASAGEDSTGATPGEAMVWLASDGSVVTNFINHAGSSLCIAWSPDGAQVATGGASGISHVWDVSSPPTPGTIVLYNPGGSPGQVNSIAWNSDGTLIASAYDGAADVQTAAGALGYTWDTDVSLAGGHADCYLDTVAFKVKFNTNVGAGLSPPDANLLSVCVEQTSVRGVSWSPSANNIVSVGDDATAYIWQASGPYAVALRAFTEHADAVLAVDWSPDGTEIVTGSADNEGMVWNAVDLVRTLTFTGHIDDLVSVAWSPDSQFVASASSDKTARVWYASTYITQTESLTDTPTASQTVTLTGTPTSSVSQSLTGSPTPSYSASLTTSPTESQTVTLTPTLTLSTDTRTYSGTQSTLSSTFTVTTRTPTVSHTGSMTTSPTMSASVTDTTYTPTRSHTTSPTSTLTKSHTVSLTGTSTLTSSLTLTQSTPSQTSSFTPTVSHTASWTPSHTQTWTPTLSTTATLTPTGTHSQTRSTASPTATLTPTPTATATATLTNTASTLSATETPTNSVSLTLTRTPTVSISATHTWTATRTRSPTQTTTQTQSTTPTYSVTVTLTPTQSVTQTFTSTRTATWTPTATPTDSLTSTSTPTVSQTVTLTPTLSTTPTLSWTPSLSFTKTPLTSSRTPTPTSTVTITRTATPTVSGTTTISETLTLTASPSLTVTTTRTATATSTTTETPTFSISDTASTPTPSASGTPTSSRSTPSLTPTLTLTFTITQTFTSTSTLSSTGTGTITITQTPTLSSTNTGTRTVTPTSTPTYSATYSTVTLTATVTASTRTSTATPTLSQTPTVTPTASDSTATLTLSKTQSTRTITPTPTWSLSTLTRSLTRTSSITGTMTGTGSKTVSPSPSQSPTFSHTISTKTGTTTSTRTPTPSVSLTVTDTQSTVTVTQTVTPTRSLTVSTPTISVTTTLTATSTSTITLSATATSTPTLTFSTWSPTATATATPTWSETDSTATSTPSISPTPTPTDSGTITATTTPTWTLTSSGTCTPTPTPSRSVTLTGSTATQTQSMTYTVDNSTTLSSSFTATKTTTHTPSASLTATLSPTPSSTPSSYSVTLTRTSSLTQSTGSVTSTSTQTPSTHTKTSTVTYSTPSPSATVTITHSPTLSPTVSTSFTLSLTASHTPTFTRSTTRSGTPTASTTLTPTLSPTPTASVSTFTRTMSPTLTESTISPTLTWTVSTASHTETPTMSGSTFSLTSSSTGTVTGTDTGTITLTTTPTDTRTSPLTVSTPTMSHTSTPTVSATHSSVTPSVTWTATWSSTYTSTGSSSTTATASTRTMTVTFSASPSLTTTGTKSFTETSTRSPSLTLTTTPYVSATASDTPSSSPSPTLSTVQTFTPTLTPSSSLTASSSQSTLTLAASATPTTTLTCTASAALTTSPSLSGTRSITATQSLSGQPTTSVSVTTTLSASTTQSETNTFSPSITATSTSSLTISPSASATLTLSTATLSPSSATLSTAFITRTSSITDTVSTATASSWTVTASTVSFTASTLTGTASTATPSTGSSTWSTITPTATVATSHPTPLRTPEASPYSTPLSSPACAIECRTCGELSDCASCYPGWILVPMWYNVSAPPEGTLDELSGLSSGKCSFRPTDSCWALQAAAAGAAISAPAAGVPSVSGRSLASPSPPVPGVLGNIAGVCLECRADGQCLRCSAGSIVNPYFTQSCILVSNSLGTALDEDPFAANAVWLVPVLAALASIVVCCCLCLGLWRMVAWNQPRPIQYMELLSSSTHPLVSVQDIFARGNPSAPIMDNLLCLLCSPPSWVPPPVLVFTTHQWLDSLGLSALKGPRYSTLQNGPLSTRWPVPAQQCAADDPKNGLLLFSLLHHRLPIWWGASRVETQRFLEWISPPSVLGVPLESCPYFLSQLAPSAQPSDLALWPVSDVQGSVHVPVADAMSDDDDDDNPGHSMRWASKRQSSATVDTDDTDPVQSVRRNPACCCGKYSDDSDPDRSLHRVGGGLLSSLYNDGRPVPPYAQAHNGTDIYTSPKCSQPPSLSAMSGKVTDVPAYPQLQPPTDTQQPSLMHLLQHMGIDAVSRFAPAELARPSHHRHLHSTSLATLQRNAPATNLGPKTLTSPVPPLPPPPPAILAPPLQPSGLTSPASLASLRALPGTTDTHASAEPASAPYSARSGLSQSPAGQRKPCQLGSSHLHGNVAVMPPAHNWSSTSAPNMSVSEVPLGPGSGCNTYLVSKMDPTADNLNPSESKDAWGYPSEPCVGPSRAQHHQPNPNLASYSSPVYLMTVDHMDPLSPAVRSDWQRGLGEVHQNDWSDAESSPLCQPNTAAPVHAGVTPSVPDSVLPTRALALLSPSSGNPGLQSPTFSYLGIPADHLRPYHKMATQLDASDLFSMTAVSLASCLSLSPAASQSLWSLIHPPPGPLPPGLPATHTAHWLHTLGFSAESLEYAALFSLPTSALVLAPLGQLVRWISDAWALHKYTLPTQPPPKETPLASACVVHSLIHYGCVQGLPDNVEAPGTVSWLRTRGLRGCLPPSTTLDAATLLSMSAQEVQDLTGPNLTLHAACAFVSLIHGPPPGGWQPKTPAAMARWLVWRRLSSLGPQLGTMLLQELVECPVEDLAALVGSQTAPMLHAHFHTLPLLTPLSPLSATAATLSLVPSPPPEPLPSAVSLLSMDVKSQSGSTFGSYVPANYNQAPLYYATASPPPFGEIATAPVCPTAWATSWTIWTAITCKSSCSPLHSNLIPTRASGSRLPEDSPATNPANSANPLQALSSGPLTPHADDSATQQWLRGLPIPLPELGPLTASQLLQLSHQEVAAVSPHYHAVLWLALHPDVVDPNLTQ